MRTILSFQLPAVSGISRESVIASMGRWITQSPHYDLEAPLPNLPSGENLTRFSADFYGRTAAFQLIQYSENDHHYIASQLEKPDEARNLLWQAQCIFAQEGERAEGTFFILLRRGILLPKKAVDLQVIPSVPFIAKRLFLDGLALKPTEIAGSQRDNYPQIQSGWRSPLKEDIKKIFSSIAHLSEQSAPEAEDRIRVIYPKAGVDCVYPGEGSNQDTEQTKARIVTDIFNAISEVHSEPKVSFDTLWHLASGGKESAAQPPSPPGIYCYMNQAMANLLKTARKERGLSQKDLAQRVGSSGLILSRLETVRVQRVMRSMLNDIERELGLPRDAIVSMQGEEASAAANSVAPTPAKEELPQKAGYCRQCGTHLYADSCFCPVCGTRVLPA